MLQHLSATIDIIIEECLQQRNCIYLSITVPLRTHIYLTQKRIEVNKLGVRILNFLIYIPLGTKRLRIVLLLRIRYVFLFQQIHTTEPLLLASGSGQKI